MNDFIGRILTRQRIRVVTPYIHGRLLDIGCGLNKLVRIYGYGVGVDIHNWGSVDCLVENSARLPYKDNEFNTVTIIAALNHIVYREDVLKESHRLLHSNGKLIITMLTPGISRIWHKLRGAGDLDLKERGMRAGEVYGFSKKELISLVSSQGFKLETCARFMCGFNSLYVFTKE